MKKESLYFGCLIFMILVFSSCKTKRKILGNKELTGSSKDWLSVSGFLTLKYKTADGPVIIFTNQGVRTFFEEVIVECDESAFRDVCEGYNMERMQCEFSSGSLPTLKFKLAVTEVANGSEYYDLYTVSMGDCGSSRAVYPNPLPPDNQASLIEQYMYADSLVVDSDTIFQVSYYKDTETSPSELYYTKTKGLVVFKLGGVYYHKMDQ